MSNKKSLGSTIHTENQDLFNPLVNPPSVKAPQENRTECPKKSPSKNERTVSNSPSPLGADSWYKNQNGNGAQAQLIEVEQSEFLNQFKLRDGATVKIYHGEIQVTYPKKFSGNRKPPKREKGDINNFSKKSGYRMTRLFNRVLFNQLSKPLFISLTARQASMEVEEFQMRFRKLFLPALKKIIANPCWIWKLEPHKSGKPHYHLLLWSCNKNFNIESEFYWRKIRKAWRNSIGQHDKAAQLYSCKIKKVTNRRDAFAYMSEYMLKVSHEDSTDLRGRRWARSKNLPVNPITEFVLSGDKIKQLKTIVRLLLAKKEKLTDFMREMIDSEYGFFIWFEPSEILGVLEFISHQAEMNQYLRYLETGNPDIPIDEMTYYSFNG